MEFTHSQEKLPCGNGALVTQSVTLSCWASIGHPAPVACWRGLLCASWWAHCKLRTLERIFEVCQVKKKLFSIIFSLNWRLEKTAEKKCKSLSHVRYFVTPWTIQSMRFSRPEYWSGQLFPSPRDLPNPGIEPRSPTLQADSLSTEPSGKFKNTGVGSLSLLQWIFPTQELNRGLLHCRQILYQLSYQGGSLNWRLDKTAGKR